MLLSVSVSVYLPMDIKDISNMNCHLKFIFTWILLITQLTGNVFNQDFDRILYVFIFSFRFIFKVPYFILTAADCCAF